MSTSTPVKRILPAAIIVAAILVLVVLVKLKPEPPKRSASFPVPLVEVYQVQPASSEVIITGFGTVRAKQRISLVSEVAGAVTSKSPVFEAGMRFEAGQLLLTIDDTNYRAARENAAASLAQAKLSLARAEEEAAVAEREWNLAGRGASGAEATPLVLHEPQLDAARASLLAAEAALAKADKDLARCRVTAPFAGCVLNSDVDAGQFVGVGTSVGAIYATDVLEVTVPLDGRDLAWVEAPRGDRPGSAATLSAAFAGENREWHGEVVRIGGAVDEASRQVSVVVEVRAEDEAQPPLEGLFVTARIRAAASEVSTVIPRALLRQGNTVWRIVDGCIDIRPVEVARLGVDEVIIAAGLATGDNLCASSLQYVTDGMRVDVPGAAKARDAATVEDGGGEAQ